MIIGKIHPGSGLGDQLFSYITTRIIAVDKGYEFGFVGKEFFKGKDFMNLDWGNGIDPMGPYGYGVEYPAGRLIVADESKTYVFDKPYYDPEVNFIEDGSVIDGYGAQDIRYFEHRLDEVREWLKVEPLAMPDDLCVINYRGGEYKYIPDLYLKLDYWMSALVEMQNKGVDMKFVLHTDDPDEANKMLLYKAFKDIELNWRSIRYAKHLIISNSAFAILPALLNENVKEVIAPKYWAGRNVGEWRRPGNYYKKFTYI